MNFKFSTSAFIFLIALAALARGAEDEWNLPAAERVAEAERAAERGELGIATRVLQRLEAEAEATTALAERAAAAAHCDRVRLALGRAHVRAGSLVREALWLRGVQLVAPAENLKVNQTTLKQYVEWLAWLSNRGVRVEKDVIELK